MRHGLLWMFCLVAISAAGAAPAGRGAPTSEDVRQLVEAGDYPRALRLAAAALSARDVSAANRCELLVLKGEAQLRMKANTAAAEAFDDSAAAAPDEQAAALSRSMAEVVRRAKGTTYVVAAKPGQPARAVDIAVRENRPAAFVALFEESLPKVEAAAKAARLSGRLPEMLDAFVTLYDLRALELAGSGGDAKTLELARPLTARALSTMSRAVADMSDTITKVQQASMVTYEQDGSSLRFTAAHRATLRQVANDCGRIARVAVDLKRAFPGEEGDALRTLRDDAERVAADARVLATARWDDMSAYDPYGQQAALPGAGGPPRGGTNRVQRPIRGRAGAGTAGNTGVGTDGRR